MDFLPKMSLSISIFSKMTLSISIFSRMSLSISISIFLWMSLSILIFSRVTLSISIFSKRVDISIIDMAYRYIEHPYRWPFQQLPCSGGEIALLKNILANCLPFPNELGIFNSSWGELYGLRSDLNFQFRWLTKVWPPLLAPDCTLPALPEERWGASLDVQATRFNRVSTKIETSSQKLGRHALHRVRSVWKSVWAG